AHPWSSGSCCGSAGPRSPEMELTPLLQAQGLAIGYRMGRAQKERTVLTGINLELFPGELVCLLGPNGAGKSTLLRTLAGLQAPLGGRLRLSGEDALAMAPVAWARKTAIVLTDR